MVSRRPEVPEVVGVSEGVGMSGSIQLPQSKQSRPIIAEVMGHVQIFEHSENLTSNNR
jgi:hypothetical protein